MTVIAWDGKSLAADRLAIMNGDTRTTSCKIERLPDGRALARCGDCALGLALARWYREGADPGRFPDEPADLSAVIVIAYRDALVYFQSQGPELQVNLDPFMAFGAGRAYALGAMAMGASAARAVEVACRWSSLCGLGCDALDLSQAPLIG